MKITFPRKSAYDHSTMSVRFPVNINGVDKVAQVSQETLQDHFGGNNNSNLVSIFEANRSIIESKVRDLIAAGVEDNLTVTTAMF